MGQEEPDIAVVGAKGQIVIPQELRKELDIHPKTKLAIYRRGDKLIVTRLKIAPLGEDLRSLFEEIDQQYKGTRKPSEEEILEEIQAYRRRRRAELVT